MSPNSTNSPSSGSFFFLRQLVFASFFLLAIAWSSVQVFLIFSSNQQVNQSPIELIQSKNLSAYTTEELQVASRSLLRDYFPPNLEEAERLTSTALSRTPLSSSLWLDLARIQVYENQPKKVQESLQMSQTFDPGFVDQRVNSLPIQFFLQENEQAIKSAKTILKQSPNSAPEVMTALISGGVRFQDITESIDLNSLDSNHLEQLAISFRLANRDDRLKFFERVLKECTLEEILTDRLIIESARQQLFPISQTFARQRYLGYSDNPKAILIDTNALQEINGAPTMLGWQQLPKELIQFHTHFPVFDQKNGILRLEVVSQLEAIESKTYRWKAYRFVRKASSLSQQLHITFQITNPDLVSLQVDIRDFTNNKGVGKPSSGEKSTDWQLAIVDLEPSKWDQILDVAFVIQAKGSPLNESVYVQIDEISLLEEHANKELTP